MYSPYVCPLKIYDGSPALIKMGLHKLEMVVMVKVRNENSVADSKIMERNLDVHSIRLGCMVKHSDLL